MPRPLLSHVDVRVSDRQRSIAFYDEVLGVLGFVRRASDGDAWTSYVDAASGPGSNVAHFSEGPGYYAVFFEDPDGHRLEVCCRTE